MKSMHDNELNEQLKRANTEKTIGNYAEAEHLANEIVATTPPHHDQHARALLVLAETTRQKGAYEHSRTIAEAALELAIKYDHKDVIPKAWEQLGLVYWILGNYTRSLEYHNRALSANEKLGENSGAAINMLNIGIVYANLGDYARALEHMSRALSVHEELGEKPRVAKVLGNIGNVYMHLGDHAHALEYLCRAQLVHEELNVKPSVARMMANIGIVYMRLCDFSQAVDYYTRALLVFEELGDKSAIASVTGNIGNAYLEFCDYSLAMSYYNRALSAHEVLGDKSGIASVMGSIGRLYAQKDFTNYDAAKAETYLLTTIAICEEGGSKHHQSTVYQFLSNLYEGEGRWKDAFNYQKKYHDLEKEVQSEEAKKQAELFHHKLKVQEFEHKLQLEKQALEAENKLLRQDLEHKAKELEHTVNQVVEKNSLLNAVTTDLSRMQGANSAVREEILDALRGKIRRHISSGAVTAMIYYELESVHGAFMSKVKAQFPALTAIEVRIAALLRMKLTSANIASLLFISQRTVELHRLRIRKKMGLSGRDNLYVALSE